MTEHTNRHDDPCWGSATIARTWHSCNQPDLHDGLHRCECGATWEPWKWDTVSEPVTASEPEQAA